MKKIKFIALFLFASIFFVACAASKSGSSEKETAPMRSDQVAQNESDDLREGSGTGGGTGSKNKTDSDSTAPSTKMVSLEDSNESEENQVKVAERKIIRNADLTLEAAKPEDVQQKITAIAQNKKGFVIKSTQRSNNSKVGGRNSVAMTIRVPSEKFSESLEEIRKTANRVVVESVTGRDVTEEFIDIEARLKTKKALEARFLEIMNRAKTVKDALSVERQLANVRGEIERIEGRKRFLENQASLSTIKIKINTPSAISASSTGFFYELKNAISDGFEFALNFVLFLVKVLIGLLPFLLLVVLPVFLLLRYLWRNYKKKRLAKKFAEEELREEKVDE